MKESNEDDLHSRFGPVSSVGRALDFNSNGQGFKSLTWRKAFFCLRLRIPKNIV